MATPESGSLLYMDEYGTIYENYWNTSHVTGLVLLDYTSIVKQPYVWGEIEEGYIKNRQVFRKGICTTSRQIIQLTEDGYIILAEGHTQTICTFQTTFNCEEKPKDVFKYHLNSFVHEDDTYIIGCGSRYTDPDNDDDDKVVFSDVAADGSIIEYPGMQPFEFVDIWDDSFLLSLCTDGT